MKCLATIGTCRAGLGDIRRLPGTTSQEQALCRYLFRGIIRPATFDALDFVIALFGLFAPLSGSIVRADELEQNSGGGMILLERTCTDLSWA
ncbi:hypothetical protein CLCR_01013 [Cladophialophora carrionii]|uniref:Uncharacterized protein n=1 Tax=Cladophialophora carrionii TaxID=86049 RepID=A0A1C1D1F8_9EURO|nr:hypothetical protein CLCR_01013 [Cladophialophora carrionii]